MTAFVSLVSSIFQPFLGPLAAAGIIKGIVAIMAACGLSAATSPMYVILNAAGGDGFLPVLKPILIALTSARRFKVNEFTAIAVAGALVYPDIATLVTALQKGWSRSCSRGYSVYASCRGLPLNSNAFYLGNLGGFIHSKNSLLRLLQMSLKSS